MDLSNLTTVAKNFSKSGLSLAKVVLISKWNTKKVKTDQTDCVILGNGPSLSSSVEQFREQIKAMDSWSVNNFPATDLFLELKPKHYVFSAPEYWLDDVRETYVVNRERIFDALSEKVDWPLNIFAPTQFKKNKKYTSKLAQNSNLNVVFYNTSAMEGFTGLANTLINAGLGIPRPHNVLIPSLILAIKCSYKNISLLGADHSWLTEISVNDQNEALLHQKHFYDEDSSKKETMFKLGKKPRLLHQMLEKFVYTFESYHFIEQYATKKGAKIWNLTPQSFIDAFERRKEL